MWQHAELVQDIAHHGSAQNGGGGGVEHVVTMPQLSLRSRGGGQPAFATAGQDSTSRTSLCALVATTFRGRHGNNDNNDEESIVLASAYKVTYQPDHLNQFQLVPQDEAGQHRRTEAEESTKDNYSIICGQDSWVC
eukprot:7934272-Ditylum_brightwellii.AAC.1